MLNKLTSRVSFHCLSLVSSVCYVKQLNFRQADLMTKLFSYSHCVHDTIHWLTFCAQIQTNLIPVHPPHLHTQTARNIYDGLTAVNRNETFLLLLHTSICWTTLFNTISSLACFSFSSSSLFLLLILIFNRWLHVFTLIILFVARLFVMLLVYFLLNDSLQLPSMYVFSLLFTLVSFVAVKCHRFSYICENCILLGVMNETEAKSNKK